MQKSIVVYSSKIGKYLPERRNKIGKYRGFDTHFMNSIRFIGQAKLLCSSDKSNMNLFAILQKLGESSYTFVHNPKYYLIITGN